MESRYAQIRERAKGLQEAIHICSAIAGASNSLDGLGKVTNDFREAVNKIGIDLDGYHDIIQNGGLNSALHDVWDICAKVQTTYSQLNRAMERMENSSQSDDGEELRRIDQVIRLKDTMEELSDRLELCEDDFSQFLKGEDSALFTKPRKKLSNGCTETL